jgi:hypothetical protein
MIKNLFKIFSGPEFLETHRFPEEHGQSAHFGNWRAVKKLGGWQVARCVYLPLNQAEETARAQHVKLEPGVIDVQISKTDTAPFRVVIDDTFPSSKKRMTKQEAIAFIRQKETRDKAGSFWEEGVASLLLPPRHYTHDSLTAAETERVQTEWVAEFISERIEKNASGRWDAYVCTYNPVEFADKHLPNRPKDYYAPGIHVISLGGENVRCRMRKTPDPEKSNMSKGEAFEWLWQVKMDRLRNAEKQAAFIVERKKLISLPGGGKTTP